MGERNLEILRSFTAPAGAGRYVLTIYQLAIEFAKRYEADFHAMGCPLGGVGAGSRALTISMANQLSKRIKAEEIQQIEVLLLHPADTDFWVYRCKDVQVIVMPPPRAPRSPIPAYWLRGATWLFCGTRAWRSSHTRTSGSYSRFRQAMAFRHVPRLVAVRSGAGLARRCHANVPDGLNSLADRVQPDNSEAAPAAYWFPPSGHFIMGTSCIRPGGLAWRPVVPRCVR